MPEIIFIIKLELDLYISGVPVRQYGVYERVGEHWLSTAHVASTGRDGEVTIGILE
mgnify:CR=1 FL=1